MILSIKNMAKVKCRLIHMQTCLTNAQLTKLVDRVGHKNPSSSRQQTKCLVTLLPHVGHSVVDQSTKQKQNSSI